MLQLILVRHGEVPGIDPPTYRGTAELALTERGRRQAAAARDAILAQATPQAVYSSPLSRCRETAGVIAAGVGHEPVVVDDLRDINYGRWTGMAEAEVKARWPEQVRWWRTHPETFQLPDGDCVTAVADRALAALVDIARRQGEGCAVIVSHDSVLRLVVCAALGMPLANYRRLLFAPCSISVLDFEAGQFRSQGLNRIAHLAGI